MGWKASIVIVNTSTEVDHLVLLNKLGYNNVRQIEDKSLEEIINPDDNEIYIGTYKNHLIICEQNMPMQFFEDSKTKIENTLYDIFPNTEICALILHSVVNLWGYAISKNGQRIRVKSGSADDGVFIEIGEPLNEEKELISKWNEMDEDAVKSKKNNQDEDKFDDEDYEEDFDGESMVFEISKRYFGVALDQDDNLLFETSFNGYSFLNSKPATNLNAEKNSKIPLEIKKPWWKFW